MADFVSTFRLIPTYWPAEVYTNNCWFLPGVQ